MFGSNDKLVIKLIPKYLRRLSLYFKYTKFCQSKEVYNNDTRVYTFTVFTCYELPSMTVYKALASLYMKLGMKFEFSEKYLIYFDLVLES